MWNSLGHYIATEVSLCTIRHPLLAVMQPTIVEMMSLLFTPVNVLMVEYGGLTLTISLAIKEVLSQFILFCIMHLIGHMCGDEWN